MDELKKKMREELSTRMVAWEEVMQPGEKAVARPRVIMDFMDGMIDTVALRVIEMCEEKTKRSKLGMLMDFYSSNRGSGHTYAAVNGVKNTPNSVLLVAQESQKQHTGLPREKQITLNGRDIVLSGRRFAVVPDHFALQLMFEEITHSLKALKETISSKD